MSNAKAALNVVFNALGQKIVPLERPTRTFDGFFAHLKRRGFSPLTVIDVGAASGTLSLHTAFPKAHFILIEALAEFEPRLKDLATRYDCEIHMVAVGREPGTTMLVLHPDPFGTYIAHIKENRPAQNQRQITVRTLEEILNAKDHKRPMLAKLDIQGFELEALRGLGTRFDSIDVFVVETSTHAIASSHPDFATVVSFMKERGYSVFDILDGLLRPLDKDLAQVDLVFVRDDGPLRREAGRWS